MNMNMKRNVATYEHFTEITNEATESLSLVIKCHYELDLILDRILELSMYDISSLEVKRISFILKVDILIGLGVVTQGVKKLLKNINAVRNAYAHNPYYIFDDENAKKMKIVIMQMESFEGFIRDESNERQILINAFTIAYVCLERSLKDRYRNIQSGVILNEKLQHALRNRKSIHNNERINLHRTEVEEELKKKYPELFDE